MEFIVESDVCLAFLPKKGNASVKSMLKVYKLEEHYDMHKSEEIQVQDIINCKGACIQGINTIGYLARMELYVPEQKWKDSSFRL